MLGWGGKLNHEERLLATVGAVGIAGTVASLWWERLSVVPIAAGGVVLFSALRALLQKIQNVTLYTETTTYGGDTVVFILGAEPFLLIAEGLLLVAAGLLGWKYQTGSSDGSGSSSAPSSTA